jgi:hypothetical protein
MGPPCYARYGGLFVGPLEPLAAKAAKNAKENRNAFFLEPLRAFQGARQAGIEKKAVERDPSFPALRFFRRT